MAFIHLKRLMDHDRHGIDHFVATEIREFGIIDFRNGGKALRCGANLSPRQVEAFLKIASSHQPPKGL